MGNKGKFEVGLEFRKNDLANKESPIEAEVHTASRPARVYPNIHNTRAFAKKVFKNDPNCTKIIFRKRVIEEFTVTPETNL